MNYFKHESSYVDDGAIIGSGTKIWHFSHIQKGAQIGERCIFGQNVNVADGVIIGSNVKVQNNVSIYTGTVIEDDVFLGPSCVLTNVTNPRSQINRHSLYEKTLIRRGATIGANATIVCGVTLGRYCFIAAGSVVTKDVPDYALMVGNPARQKGWMSRHGHILRPEAGGQRAEGRDQRVEDRDQKSEIRSQKSGADSTIFVCPESGYRYQLKSEVREQRSENSGQRSENSGQRSEISDQRSEVRVQQGTKNEDRRPKNQEPSPNPRQSAPSVVSSLPSSLCPLPSALCPLPSDLRPLSSALCPLPSPSLRCLDLDEEAPLPPELTQGTKTYDELKR
jgi:UDP-2-acetamido-3-amino-2,3-dideoxy-glucuronate N-acetyltransferase